MSYLGRSAKLSLKAQEKVSFLATAGQTSKTGLSYTPSFVEVYVNGVLLTDTTDFTATNGNSITFTVALLLNDEVTVISLKTFTVADHYTKSDADTLLALKSTIASPSFTGKVGIGSSSPVRQLEIKDDGTLGQAIVGIIADAGDPAGIFMGTTSNNNAGGIRYFTDTNKLTLRANDEDRLLIDAAGIVTKPYQPAFLATKTTTSSNAAINADHTVLFPTEVYDQNSDFSSNTFTAPVTGKYLLTASLRLDQVDEAANYYLLGIIGSNRSFREIWNPGGITDNDSYHTLQVSGLLDMDANDTAIVRFNQNAGNPQVDQDGNAEMSYFCGHLVC